MHVLLGFKRIRGGSLLLRHIFLLWRARLLRWRLETFGLYMPSLPGKRPWWRVNASAFRILLEQGRPYQEWLDEMAVLQRGGPPGWWQQRLGHSYQPLQQWVAFQNEADSSNPLPSVGGVQ